METLLSMAKKSLDEELIYVPKVGEVVTYITPQQKKIPDCTVVRLFDGSGRVRVKGVNGDIYSGTLDQVKPQM